MVRHLDLRWFSRVCRIAIDRHPSSIISQLGRDQTQELRAIHPPHRLRGAALESLESLESVTRTSRRLD
jgi:hypothetical protein